MTRQAFIEAALAGKREADEFVAGCMGWEHRPAVKHRNPEGYWRDDFPYQEENCTICRTPPPYATCPDSDPRSWALFGEMWDKLPRTKPGIALGLNWEVHDLASPTGFYTDRWMVTCYGGDPRYWHHAPTRCLAVAVALLEAMGTF